MNTITITQESGSVHNLAADYDVIIEMGNRFEYAVVLPSFYNINPSRHIDSYNALKRYDYYKSLGYEGVTLLNTDGSEVQADDLRGWS